jgi:hypothetical protein
MSDQSPNISEVDLSKLPIDKQEDMTRLLLIKRLETKEDLKMWLQLFLEVDLADCTVSRFATSNPLDMVWQIYKFWCDDTVKKPMTIYFIAGRSSQKTLSMACLQVLLPLHFGVGVVHFGGTSEQATRAYDYFNGFVSKPYVKEYLKDEPTQKQTVFTVHGNDVVVQILSISPARVQGPHQPAVSLDELSSLTPDKMSAYDDLSGVPIASLDGHPWVMFGISSRKGKHTIIETEYDRKDKTGILFKFWTVFENTRACPVEIRGDERLEMYVNAVENSVLLKKEFDSLDPHLQSKYEYVNAYKGCYTCPLAGICSGDMANQTSTCKTLRTVETVIEEFKTAPSLEWFLSQKMAMTPESDQMVFPKFNRDRFLKTPREIWTIWKGEDPGRDIAKEELVAEMIAAGVDRYAGVDHGFTHPFAMVVIFHDPADRVYIMEVIKKVGLEPSDVEKVVEQTVKKYDLKVIYPDTARPDINKTLKKIIKVGDSFDKDPDLGITLIRGKIAPTVGSTRFFGIAGSANPLADEIEKYHYVVDSGNIITEDIAKIFDDAFDALSYGAQNRWKNKTVHIPEVEKPKILTGAERTTAANQKINQQFSELIKEHVADKDGGSVTRQSKNKGVSWDF